MKIKKEKILKSPKFKTKGYSATQMIKGLAAQQGPLVREVQNQYADPQIDDRSLYFKEEFKKEKNKAFGGFL